MSKVKIKSSWPRKPLKQVTEVIKGKKPPRFASKSLKEALPYLEASFLRGQSAAQLVAFREAHDLTLANESDTLVLWDGANAGDIFRGQYGIVASTMARVRTKTNQLLPEFLFFYLLAMVPRLRDTAAGSTVPHVRGKVLEEVGVPLPPLPVQERIVEILQKADEIRLKRKKALELAEGIRGALFVEMFGDPGSNPKGWPIAPLNDLLDPAIEPVNPALAFPDTEFTYIEIASVKDFRIAEVKRLPGAEAPSRARQVVRAGDVLYSMTRPNLRKIAVVPQEYDGAICTTGFAVLRPRKPDDSPFVFEIVKSDHFTEAMSRLAHAKSLYPAVDEGQVRQFQVIHPPAPARAHFGRAIDHLFGVGSRAHTGTQIGQSVFSSLLSRAFTGELTAEWEAANAEWIAAQQALYERLPQLLILAFIAEKAKRARRSAEVLVTALMKYIFLVQMEGSAARRRFYHFVPYHYGPFAKELYSDLQTLQQDGLVRVEADAEEDKTKIILPDPAKAERAISTLPDDLKEAAARIIETYGDLDHNTLLETVYEKYPAYARKSRLKRNKKTK